MNSLQPEKRIVSKGEYAQKQAERAGTGITGAGHILFAVLCGVAAVVLVYALVYHLCHPTRDFELDAFVPKGRDRHCVEDVSGTLFMNAILFFMLGGLAYIHGVFGCEKIVEAMRFDSGVPLTHANTLHLPAADSLVRAAQEPAEDQKAVLLRAVIPNGERHAEQLVRPVAAETAVAAKTSIEAVQ